MPPAPVNSPLTPSECVEYLRHKLDKLIEAGACVCCAYTLVAHEYNIEVGRLYDLISLEADEH